MRTQPLASLPQHLKQLLADLKREKAAVLVNDAGRPAAYVVDTATWEAIQQRLRLLEGLARGEKAIAEGRTLTQAHAKKKMARWFAR